jgi:3-oxoacyl-[acyl-carrier protein] reductase
MADVTDERQVESMVGAVVSTFGRIDMLVNNAAVRREMPFAKMSYAEWREINSIILDGAFLCARACAPEIAKAGGGSIVNIGGITAHTGAKARAHVITAKSGLSGFMRALALDLMDDGITVNCVVPGRMRTVRAGDALPRVHAAGTVAPGDPEDVAAVVQFLCGRGGRHITGQSIHVNGGQWMT